MSQYYTTSQASAITGASVQTIRAYTKLYARYFSTEATPTTGLSRRFTADDLRLIRFAFQQTAAGNTREQVSELLAAGALTEYEWQPPAPEAASTEPVENVTEPGTALVPLERLQAAHTLLQDAQHREQAAAEQVASLQAEVQRLATELGKAQGELQGFRSAQYRAPKWWRSMFGGRAGE